MKKRDLKFYLSLKYDIIIREIVEDGEILYTAFTNELDKLTFYGIGSTAEEAIASFQNVKEELFPYYIEHGLSIPEPEVESDELPSGKFVIRTSPKRHLGLIKLAQKNNQSLNQYINTLFENLYTGEKIIEFAENRIKMMVDNCEHQIKNMYKITPLYDTDNAFAEGRSEHRLEVG